MTDEQFKEVLRRLDLIASLLIEGLSKEGASVTEKAVRLQRMGLSNSDIGRLLGKPANAIAATLSMYKKRKKKNGG